MTLPASLAALRHADESEHCSVDGALIQSWASRKSFRPKDEEDVENGNRWGGFQGRKRSNEAHEPKIYPEARRRMMRRGNTARYRKRQREKKMIESTIGWLKEISVLKRARYVGR